jgi:hypothetical protein
MDYFGTVNCQRHKEQSVYYTQCRDCRFCSSITLGTSIVDRSVKTGNVDCRYDELRTVERKSTTINYEIRNSYNLRTGRSHSRTPCTVLGRGMVGSLMCEDCKYHISHNERKQLVVCKATNKINQEENKMKTRIKVTEVNKSHKTISDLTKGDVFRYVNGFKGGKGRSYYMKTNFGKVVSLRNGESYDIEGRDPKVILAIEVDINIKEENDR